LKEVTIMPASKAQQRATNKYIKANYDRMEIVVPKGKKAEIKAHATDNSESVNGFVNRAISETMERDTSPQPTGTSVRAANPLASIITPASLKVAQKAAQATGEDMPAFMARAVDRAVRTDEAAWSIGVNPATGKEIQKGDRKRK